MFDLLPRFKRLWLYISGSIAYVPSLWVVGFILFAIVIRFFEEQGLSAWIYDNNLLLEISAPDTARTILSSIIGGVLSLTVFSFSMVMIVLSQATNTLSPRLLPQLIRDRSHQNTLGLYLGVITYCYITLIGINPREEWELNSFSIFLAMLMVIACLAFFVFFIASISRRIQVGEVIKGVHARAVRDILHWQDSPKGWSLRGLPDGADNWFPVRVIKSGYVDATMYQEVSNLAKELEVRLYLLQPRSAYVVQGEILFRSDRPLTNEELEKAKDVIRLTDNREQEFWYFPAIRHITEVAVKAMSPGINDPGTAVEATNLLSDLFLQLLRLPQFNHYQTEEDGGEVFFVQRSCTETITMVFAQLRVYSKADPSVMRALYECLNALRSGSKSAEVMSTVRREMEALKEDGRESLTNSYDRKAFLAMFDPAGQ